MQKKKIYIYIYIVPTHEELPRLKTGYGSWNKNSEKNISLKSPKQGSMVESETLHSFLYQEQNSRARWGSLPRICERTVYLKYFPHSN
jgi:hypothetical protein